MTTAQEPLTNAIPPFPFFLENPIDTNQLPDRCQFADPTRSSGESHQQDELSPVNKVVPSDEPERGISPEPLPDRCQFTFSDGRQCRMARSEIHPSLCPFHSEREDQLFGEPSPGGNVVGAALDLPELYSACRDLTTAAGVNRALAQVFRLLAQRRISRQEAATFGHLAQLLLRTISAMRAESADPIRIGVPSEQREPRDLSVSSPVNRHDDATSVVTPYSGESDAATSPPRKGYPPAAKVYQQDELSPPNKGALFAGNKVIPNPPSADERGAQFASRTVLRETPPVSSPVKSVHSCAPPAAAPAASLSSQASQNEDLRNSRVQLTQNEHLQNLEA